MDGAKIGLVPNKSDESTPQTVGQQMDLWIKEARQQLESLCVKKAKLETLGMLELPHMDLCQLLQRWNLLPKYPEPPNGGLVICTIHSENIS